MESMFKNGYLNNSTQNDAAPFFLTDIYHDIEPESSRSVGNQLKFYFPENDVEYSGVVKVAIPDGQRYTCYDDGAIDIWNNTNEQLRFCNFSYSWCNFVSFYRIWESKMFW